MSRNPKYQIKNLSTDGFGRLVQIINGVYYDGFGNLLNIGSNNQTGSTLNGTSGTSGVSGSSGTSGTSDKYITTTVHSVPIPNINDVILLESLDTGLAYSVGQSIVIAKTSND